MSPWLVPFFRSVTRRFLQFTLVCQNDRVRLLAADALEVHVLDLGEYCADSPQHFCALLLHPRVSAPLVDLVIGGLR